ncbi:hypothetical protein ACIBCO_17265 [Streptomyces violascens]|uniref:hypothetical protein n=1 Tax=Streptomyces violascens TaxID=67381 RepID=UPI0037A5F0B7
MYASHPPGNGDYTMPPSAPPIQGVQGCGSCSLVVAELRRAVRDGDLSAEVDARVKIRRHMRQVHGTEIPFFAG